MHPYDAMQLARELMARHGLAGWRFQFDHARRRFGSCQYGKKLITLSRPLTLLNDIEQVRDTVLHEIAHALTPGSGHDGKWRAKCIEIGAKPVRCYTDQAVRSPARSPARYRLGCRTCGWWVERRRITGRRYICTRCHSRLILEEKGTVGSGRVELRDSEVSRQSESQI